MAVPISLKQRWIRPLHSHGTETSTSAAVTSGRVYLMEFEVYEPAFVDQILWYNGAAVSGNVRVGIYGPLVTEETCEGSVVVYDSGSIAQSGTNAAQTHTLSAPVQLTAGRYYVAFEADNATSAVFRLGNIASITGWVQIYDRAGGYGALISPCPVPTNSLTLVPSLKIRCLP
jgi:hypothetical protein